MRHQPKRIDFDDVSNASAVACLILQKVGDQSLFVVCAHKRSRGTNGTPAHSVDALAIPRPQGFRVVVVERRIELAVLLQQRQCPVPRFPPEQHHTAGFAGPHSRHFTSTTNVVPFLTVTVVTPPVIDSSRYGPAATLAQTVVGPAMAVHPAGLAPGTACAMPAASTRRTRVVIVSAKRSSTRPPGSTVTSIAAVGT